MKKPHGPDSVYPANWNHRALLLSYWVSVQFPYHPSMLRTLAMYIGPSIPILFYFIQFWTYRPCFLPCSFPLSYPSVLILLSLVSLPLRWNISSPLPGEGPIIYLLIHIDNGIDRVLVQPSGLPNTAAAISSHVVASCQGTTRRAPVSRPCWAIDTRFDRARNREASEKQRRHCGLIPILEG